MASLGTTAVPSNNASLLLGACSRWKTWMQLFGGQKSCLSNKFWQNADGAGPWTRAAEAAGGMAQRTHLEKHLMCQKYLF